MNNAKEVEEFLDKEYDGLGVECCKATGLHRIADALERIALTMEGDIQLSKKLVTEMDKTMVDLDSGLDEDSSGVDLDKVSEKMKNREPLTDAEAFAMQMHDENRTR